jgi:hypothetical protein
MVSRFFPVLFLAVCLIPAFLLAQPVRSLSGAESELGALYAGYAYDAYNAGEKSDASRLANAALVFDPGNRDALAVSALLTADGGELESALRLFEKAAAAYVPDQTALIDVERLRRRMADTALRLGFPERSYLYLLPLTEGERITPETGALFVKILSLLGKKDESVDVARELASRYPSSSLAVKVYLQVDAGYLPPFLIKPPDKQKAVQQLSAYDKDVYQLLYVRLRNQELKHEIAGAYKERFGEDLFWYLTEGIGDVMDPQERASLIGRALAAHTPASREAMHFFRSLFTGETDRETYDAWFASFSGLLISDLNGDGYSETSERYKDGILTEYRLDQDQNGRYEYRVDFGDGRPSSIQSDTWKLTYADYPYIDQAELSDDTGTVTYMLYPYSMIHRLEYLPRLTDSLNDSKPVVHITFPVEERISARSLSEKRYVKENSETITMDRPFAGGVEYHITSPREGDVREQRRSDGTFIIRERDPDDDGIFEVKERYLDNKLIELTFDENGDGHPEYMESHGEQTVYLWDLNDDGLYDCREYIDESGRSVREVSTKLDGVFDFRLNEEVEGT